MRKLFLPAVSLMNKLNYAQKFTVLGVIYFVAVAVMVVSLYEHLSASIHNSQRQLQGIALIKPIVHTIQLMQEHRGLELAMLSGNEAMRAAHNAKESEVDAAVLTLNQQWLADFSSDSDWQRFKDAWQTLHKTQYTLSIAEDFVTHVALIEQLQQFEVKIADNYALTFDSDIAAYYLIDTTINKLPLALEQLGQMRAFGTSILTKKQLTETEKIKLFTLISEFNDAFKALRINLEKTSNYNTEMQATVLTATNDIEQSAQYIIELVQMDILSKQFATPSEVYFSLTTVAINKGYEQLYQSLLPALEQVFNARIQQARKELQQTIGIACMALLLAMYIFTGIYYATLNCVKSLAHSAQQFANGDLQARIQLNTCDELQQVGINFNAMAESLNTLLETHKDDEERLHTIINAAFDAVIQMDANGTISGWNKQAEVMFGWSSAEALGRELNTTIVPLRYREAHIQGYQRYLKSGIGAIFHSLVELEALHREGHEFPIELSVAPVKTARGIEFSAFIRDITERKRTEAALRIAAVAFESQEGMLVSDANNIILRVNHAFTLITGYSAEDVIGRSPSLLATTRKDKARCFDLLENVIKTGCWQGEIMNRRKNGNEYPVSMTVTAVKDTNAETTHYILTFTDITERKSAEEKITQLAFYDPLTDLPNRRKLLERLEFTLAMSHRKSTQFAVLMMDLDYFKAVNDSFGHLAGDELLQQVAKRLKTHLRDTDMVARLGGDEFVILLEDIKNKENAARVATNIITDLATPFLLLGNQEVRVGASIGISLYPQHGNTAPVLMDYADTALYQAKNKGRGCFDVATLNRTLFYKITEKT